MQTVSHKPLSCFCNICMEEFPTKCCVGFKCQHYYHKQIWEEIGSPNTCPICEYVSTNNLRQIPFLIVVREALGNIFLASNKSTPLHALQWAMNRITANDDLFDSYLMGMQCYNKWNSDEEAITAVIITVASLVSSKFETAFRQFASQFSTRMLGKNVMNGPDAQFILLDSYTMRTRPESLYRPGLVSNN